MFLPMQAELNQSDYTFRFQSGMKIQLGHLQHETTVYDWQGAQIPYIGFDELTHFTKVQFFYMMSRNRSMSGVSGYIRATCNPDADSWVADFISWWIDQDTGYAIPERSGLLRYFLRAPDDTLIWADDAQGCIKNYLAKFPRPDGEMSPKSVTFIPANVFDNKILMAKDPSYLANLDALPAVERERLKHGNWKIKATAGLIFRREWFPVVEHQPAGLKKIIRYWDRAATVKTEDNDPDWTVGMRAGIDDDGFIYILDVRRFREGPFKVQSNMRNTTEQDGLKSTVWIQHDPAQAGKVEAAHLVKALLGFSVKLDPVPKASKELRAQPASAQAEQGKIKVLKAPWNEDFFNEVENFPQTRYKDQVDTLSGIVQVYGGNIVGTWSDDMLNNKGNTLTRQLEKRNEW